MFGESLVIPAFTTILGSVLVDVQKLKIACWVVTKNNVRNERRVQTPEVHITITRSRYRSKIPYNLIVN